MTAWVPLLATIIGALLTAVLGNRLVQVWQQRNWRNQQQFLGLEKDYTSLKGLTEELLGQCGERLSSMRELAAAVRRDQYADELATYRLVLARWNGKLHTYYALLTFYTKWHRAIDLEHEIHDNFAAVGRRIESAIRKRRSGTEVAASEFDKIGADLNGVAGSVANFSRRLVRETELRRVEVFYGRKLAYTMSDIVRLGNVDLIKLLFVSNIDTFSVVRPTLDVGFPLGGGLERLGIDEH